MEPLGFAKRRRRRRLFTRLAAFLGLLLLALGLALAVRPATFGFGGKRYHGTDGMLVVRFELRSRLVGATLHETAVVPPGTRRRPLLVFLHGRGSSADAVLSDTFFRTLRGLGASAPIVLLPDGGDHSYWHDRRDGRWGSYVVREAIPTALRRFRTNRRVAIGGISMGGFGALDIARLYPLGFCAVGAHSAALWRRGSDTAAGAFDNARDFARHDVLGVARRHPHLYGERPVWIDGGDADPFRAVDAELARTLRGRITYHLWPGGHESAYWDAHMRAYLRFYARSLARCSTGSQ
jgi:S-formylglutathione hydrolase FrmB